jgi:Domain of unknown function (DUF4398)
MATLKNTLCVCGAFFIILVASCATTNPLAEEKIAVAKASIERAEQAGAAQAAPVDLMAAHDKLAKAQKADADHEDRPAVDLAEQANIDAQVAEAAAQQQKSQKAAVEFDSSMQALRQEIAHGAAAAQSSPQ